MAIYRFEAKVISRGGGRSAVGAAAYRTGSWARVTSVRTGKSVTSAAAYRAAVVLEDERTGQRHDYSRKRGVLGAEIMLPKGAPSWMTDRAALWNAIEIIEKRKDAQLARDFILSLPHELNHEERVALTRDFVREQFCARGYIADIAWHAPDKSGGLNWHAHVMTPMRTIEGTGFARKKERAEGDGLKHPAAIWKEGLTRLRQAWADTANRHLAAAGLDIVIDPRSLEERGIDREPEPKQGPLATKMERDGRESRAGADRRAARMRNAERARLKIEHAQAIAEEARIVDLMTHRPKGEEPQMPSDEILRQQQKREAELLGQMRDQDERLQAFKRQAERDAEEAKRKQAETARDANYRAQNGDISSASARYSVALGEQYDIRDPYGSLARAAMQEYAMFHRRQEQLRDESAKEKDPEQRRIVDLKRQIEGHEYMAITSDRLAGMSAVIAGRGDAPQAVLDRERAQTYQERARELREECSRLIAEREKRGEQNGAQPHGAPDKQTHANDSSESGARNREENEQAAKAAGRKEGPIEMTDARQAKLAKLQETEGLYAAREAQKQQARDRGAGGRGGR
jgi:hypothetical protein